MTLTEETATRQNMKLSLRQRIEIVEANYGREWGWEVLSEEDEPLATLTEPGAPDAYDGMFWTSYIITPINKNDQTQTEEFWYPDCHRIRSIRYPSYIVDTFGHYNPERNRATIRFDYILVSFNWIDRVRAPLWFWFRS